MLSGGGIRAMVFHLGVLEALARRGLFEHVLKLSTVSGGSLLVGLLLQENGLVWPTSARFLETALPALRAKLCSRSLQLGALRQLVNPGNWRFVLSRANLLAAALRKEWGVLGTLGDLPNLPEWSINGTTAETGKRFRFKRDDMGDYSLGYSKASNVWLANAMAVSAAFPGGFGPLVIATGERTWTRREWGSPAGSEKSVAFPFAKLHLYDGGVYDNLGLEPVFDAGRGTPKHEGLRILVSDASAQLTPGFSYWALSPFRLKRVADIMGDQARALRVRTFWNYVGGHPERGAMLSIIDPGSDGDAFELARRFPTTLRRLSLAQFDAIATHGRGVADNALDTV